jgi:hypothetical protein
VLVLAIIGYAHEAPSASLLPHVDGAASYTAIGIFSLYLERNAANIKKVLFSFCIRRKNYRPLD